MSFDRDFPNNIIMYCAERGGGKSSSMRAFTGALANMRKDKKSAPEVFLRAWGIEADDWFFSVLNVIDPSETDSNDLFMRLVLSRMFTELKLKWNDKSKSISAKSDEEIYSDKYSRRNITNKIMECYRFLDTIYQKKGKFDCDDDFEELVNLADSGMLKEKFWNLVRLFLEEISGRDSKNNFLVIQVDDSDLNPQSAFRVIEDIRRFCMIPNVIVLMSVNIKQMHQVLEQHFVSEFKVLFNASRTCNDDDQAIRLKDCQKMAMRYIDKIMPAAHQIHLPRIEDFIKNGEYELFVQYIAKGGEIVFDSLRDIRDYQGMLIRLIYDKTGLIMIKPDGYLHSILPKTMRGLCHFLAYMKSLPDLDSKLGIAQIDELLNGNYNDSESLKILGKSKEDAENELSKRIENLKAFQQYFLKNWCTVRLFQSHQMAITTINETIGSLKISVATSWISKLFGDIKENINANFSKIPISIKNIMVKMDDNFEEIVTSKKSYLYLYKKLQVLRSLAHFAKDATETYYFIDALNFYFLLDFNYMLLLDIRNSNDFLHLLRNTDMELWIPDNAELNTSNRRANFAQFELNLGIIKEFIKNDSRAEVQKEERDEVQGEERDEVQGEERDEVISESVIFLLMKENCFIAESQGNILFKEKYNGLDLYKAFDLRFSELLGEKIVCNLSMLLINYICSKDRPNDDRGYLDLLKAKNIFIALLSSWELQRYLETKFEFISSFVSNPYAEWINKSLKCLNEIIYLPIEWKTGYFLPLLNTDIIILMLANKELALVLAEMCIESLKEKIEDEGKNESRSIYEISDAMGGFYKFREMKEEIKCFRILQTISDEAGKIVKAYDEVKKCIDKDLNPHFNPFANSKIESQENNFQFQHFIFQAEEFEPYRESKQRFGDLISSKETLDKLIKQITDAFDRNQRERGES